MLKRQYLFLIAVILTSLTHTSCVNYHQLVSLSSHEQTNETVKTYKSEASNFKLKAGDNIDIRISSSDPNTNSLLNRESNLSHTSQMNPISMYLNSYSIDAYGNIEYPLIGKIKAEGLSTNELSDTISEKLTRVLKLKNVGVKISNFRISILGEVRNAGQYFVYNDQINILQALSLAGDIADYGNRQRVQVIRSYPNKDSETVYLDLSLPNCLSSKYFWLQPNDVVYVEPIRAKAGKMNLPALQISLTSISILLVIFSLFR